MENPIEKINQEVINYSKNYETSLKKFKIGLLSIRAQIDKYIGAIETLLNVDSGLKPGLFVEHSISTELDLKLNQPFEKKWPISLKVLFALKEIEQGDKIKIANKMLEIDPDSFTIQKALDCAGFHCSTLARKGIISVVVQGKGRGRSVYAYRK